jgi:hypothetical protein
MWLLIPLLVLALLALAVVGIVVAVVSVIAMLLHAVPIFFILLGVWLLVRAIRGSGHRDGRQPRERHRHRDRQASRQPDVRQAETPSESRAPRELPIDVNVKVEQIRRKADVLLGFADRFPPFSQDLYLVRQTTADYLPTTIAAYLAVPGDEDLVPGADGKSLRDELREQLDLLDAKLDDIAENLQRQDVDRLLANRRFLEERFAPREDAPTVDPPRQEPTAV